MALQLFGSGDAEALLFGAGVLCEVALVAMARGSECVGPPTVWTKIATEYLGSA